MPYYQILGIPRDSTPADVKQAYRRLAMRWHPDRNDHPDSTERFKQIQAAYDAVLNRRDALLEEDCADEPSSTTAIVRAPDIRLSLEITLAQAFSGCSKTIHYQRGSACTTCAGSGEHGISRTRFCGPCHGSGRLRDKQSGLISCHDCDGRGFFIERICPDCSGLGRHFVDVSLQIKIPPGMLAGDDLRLAGQGEPGNENIQAGDLFLSITISSHPQFRMQGRDLYLEMPVNALALIAGSQINVPLPLGSMTIILEAGDISIRQLTIPGKGYPGRGHLGAGDFHLKIRPVFPSKTSPGQRKMLQRVMESFDASRSDHFPDIENWWSDFKDGDSNEN